MESWKSSPTSSGETRQEWSQTGSTLCRTRAQNPSLLTLSLFTMWPMHTYYGMRLDTFKSIFSLAYIITCLFLMEGKSCPVIDNPRSWARVHQGFMHHIPRKELSDTIDFQILVSSWHSLESSKKGETYFCFCFIFNNSNKNFNQVAEQILWFISKCQSTEGKKDPFPQNFSSWISIAPWMGVSLIRMEMHFDDLHDLFKSRDFNTLEEAGKWGNNIEQIHWLFSLRHVLFGICISSLGSDFGQQHQGKNYRGAQCFSSLSPFIPFIRWGA